MRVLYNEPLAPYTSFGVGGPAEILVLTDNSNELKQALFEYGDKITNTLGFGTNVLISDSGLRGVVVIARSNEIEIVDDELIAASGVWWDDLVKFAISRGLFGVELLSGVPGGVGGAIYINITAYGQSASDSLEWIEVLDTESLVFKKIMAKPLSWGYKDSVFQTDNYKNTFVVRAGFRLSKLKTHELTYQSALDVANDLQIETANLEARRHIILEARKRAGSLFEHGKGYEKTVGSFFRNPIVSESQAKKVINFDETGKTARQIATMNKVHGGDELRVSAAHVMLAAGYSRGQIWNNVRLHPKNLLKIENTGNASAQEIYNVAQDIIRNVDSKLGIQLEPEARILGEFA